MATKFRYNPAATAQLASTVAMVATLRAAAEESAESSKAIAPVDTGEYRDSIWAEAGIVRGFAVGRVIAGKFTAGWLEFGTSDTPTFAPLRRGAEGAGLRFVSSR
jgi:hypothetical protein